MTERSARPAHRAPDAVPDAQLGFGVASAQDVPMPDPDNLPIDLSSLPYSGLVELPRAAARESLSR